MNKYYTPDLKEFHIGFEYEEYLKSEGEWNWECQKVEEVYEFTYYKDQINADNIRVKYLDKEDIENLGFSYDNNSNSFKIWEKYKMYELVKNSDIVNIIIYRQTKMTAKELPFSTWEEFNIFNGIIKNKSELKKLMNQLSIL